MNVGTTTGLSLPSEATCMFQAVKWFRKEQTPGCIAAAYTSPTRNKMLFAQLGERTTKDRQLLQTRQDQIWGRHRDAGADF